MLSYSNRQRGQYRRRQREREGKKHLERRVRLYLLRIVGSGYELKLYVAMQAALRAIILDGERNPCESLVREWCAKAKAWAQHSNSWFFIRRLGRSLYLSASLFGQKAYQQHFVRKFAKPPRTTSGAINNKEDIKNRHPSGVRRAPARHRPPAAGICRLAAWVARKDLGYWHEWHPGVAFSFGHAFNFALKWLKSDAPRKTIVDAYVAALRECHATASDLRTTWSPSSTYARANRTMQAWQRGEPAPSAQRPAPTPRPATPPPAPIVAIEPEPAGWWEWFNARYPTSEYSHYGAKACRDWAHLPSHVRRHIIAEYRTGSAPEGWWEWLNAEYPGNNYGEGGVWECRDWQALPRHIKDLILAGMRQSAAPHKANS